MKPKIEILKGMNPISFGMHPEQISKIMGAPDETEEVDSMYDGTLDSIIWHYLELDLSFFFDASGLEPELITIETGSPEAELDGEKIYKLDQKQTISLIERLGYSELEQEDETWGEHRITFDDAQIDFYFNVNEMTLVSWSAYKN
jgi:hypothetical protein